MGVAFKLELDESDETKVKTFECSKFLQTSRNVRIHDYHHRILHIFKRQRIYLII